MGRIKNTVILCVCVFVLVHDAVHCRSYQQTGEMKMAEQRRSMVLTQIQARGIKDPLVVKALLAVPRHLFVPAEAENSAYADHPLFIGSGQTISQPYMVALMTELLRIKRGDRILEIGTGSGYQAAVLAEIVGADNVFTIEIIPALGRNAETVLKKLGYGDIHCKIGDGYLGWPDRAPFTGIIVTAAPDHIPKPLIEQLDDGGRLVVPVDNDRGYQTLKVVTKRGQDVLHEDSLDCRFVPLLGEHGKSVSGN